MVLILVVCVVITLYNVYVYRWSRSQLENRLISSHRDFMHSIKVRGAEGVDSPLGMDQLQNIGFAIEIDGDIRPYESLFSDFKTLSRLNDLEVIRLAKKYKKNKHFAEASWVVVILLGMIALYI